MLDTLIKEKWLRANGVIGFFPANVVGDDIEVYTDETRTEVLTTFTTCGSSASTGTASRTGGWATT